MLSLEEQSVYDALCAITGDNEVYKIVEADEIMEALPPAVKLTKVQLSQIIKDLKERDYIRVKYFTPEEYCLLTPKLAPVSSSQPAQPVEATVVAKPERELYGEKKKTEKAVSGVRRSTVFFMALLGSLLGSAVVAAIAIVIIKFVL